MAAKAKCLCVDGLLVAVFGDAPTEEVRQLAAEIDAAEIPRAAVARANRCDMWRRVTQATLIVQVN